MSQMHSIGIAGLKVVAQPDTLRTTLGSCVGVAIYDRVAKIGGMVHVMLPSSESGQGDPGKFADTAVDTLLDEVVSAGCKKERLSAKLAGGASMFGPAKANGLGDRNVQAVQERLAKHGVKIVAKEVGGQKGRKMMLTPATGEVEVQIIGAEPTVI